MSRDELDGQEEKQLQYLDQEKLSYITNYLEQTRDTDVHSVSTEDDSGKPGSNSAPSEFGFEETSGKTQSIPRVPNPSPLSICQLVRFQGGGHLSLRVCPGMLHRDQFIVYSSSQRRRRREKTELKKNRLDDTITTTTNNNNSLYCALDTKSVKTLRNGPDKNDGNNGNEHVGMQKRC